MCDVRVITCIQAMVVVDDSGSMTNVHVVDSSYPYILNIRRQRS